MGSTYELCAEDELKQAILAKLDSPTVSLFDELQANLFDWSISNIYQSFLKSPQYYEYLGKMELHILIFIPLTHHPLGKPNPYEKIEGDIEVNDDPPVSPSNESRRSGWFQCLSTEDS